MGLGGKMPGQERTHDRTKKKRNTPARWLSALYGLAVVTGIYFSFLNIQPYAKAISFLSGRSINQAFIYLISVIPIVNGVASFIGLSVTWILGAILWAVIQIIEILPIVLYSYEGFMNAFIGRADTRQRFEVKEQDDPALRMLKKIYNALPTSTITKLERLRYSTYVVDFIICLAVYSPVAGGNVIDFFFVLFTGQWNKIDLGNLLLAVITLFAVETIVSIIIWVGKLADAVKEGMSY